jgi:hypothetical protein
LAIGDVLFGVKVCSAPLFLKRELTPGVHSCQVPAGRTIQTILPKTYQDEISIFDFGMRPGPSDYPRPDCPLPVQQCPNASEGVSPARASSC